MMQEEFRTYKHSLIFNGVCASYACITQLVFLINCISFPCKGNDCSFVVIKFHTVSCIPIANGIDVSFYKYTISCRGYCANILISAKKFLVFNRIAEVINKNIKQQRPTELRNTRKHLKRCQDIWHKFERKSTSYLSNYTASWYNHERASSHWAW
jgi:hypothetical protein